MTRRLVIAPDVRARAEALRRHGASLEAISQATGLSVTTVRVRLADALERGLPGGRRAGRPQWRPSEGDRAEVARLAAVGVAQELIAQRLGISAPTLRRHCRAELAGGSKQRRRREAEFANAVRASGGPRRG